MSDQWQQQMYEIQLDNNLVTIGKKKSHTCTAFTLNQVKMRQLAEYWTGWAAAAKWQFGSSAGWQVERQPVYERVRDSSAGHESVREEKWLVKELLLLQYHVAPQPSSPVREIHQVGSSLPGVLCSFSTVARLRVATSIGRPCMVWLSIDSSYHFMLDVSELLSNNLKMKLRLFACLHVWICVCFPLRSFFRKG